MNRIELIGIITEVNPLQTFQSGAVCTRFCVETAERAFTTADGRTQPERRTTHRAIAWSNVAREAASLQVGQRAYILGRYESNSFTDRETGEIRTRLELTATWVEPLIPKQ